MHRNTKEQPDAWRHEPEAWKLADRVQRLKKCAQLHTLSAAMAHLWVAVHAPNLFAPPNARRRGASLSWGLMRAEELQLALYLNGRCNTHKMCANLAEDIDLDSMDQQGISPTTMGAAGDADDACRDRWNATRGKLGAFQEKLEMLRRGGLKLDPARDAIVQRMEARAAAVEKKLTPGAKDGRRR